MVVSLLVDDPGFWHRVQFGFTIAFHYLFPQLTMGLALLVFLLKWYALKKHDMLAADAARFWTRIFGINFAMGVATGVPMEFQFGTNWSRFSRYAGGVVGQTLALEGMFAFFLESAFVAALVWGERRLGPRRHLGAAFAVLLGSWLSAYFIVTTNAFMQHPVGYALENGRLVLNDFWAFLFNPWALLQFAHTLAASVVTAAFVMTAVGAFYTLGGKHLPAARLFLRWGTAAGLVAALFVAFPTGDRQAKAVAEHQPVTLAAMEGRFESGPWAELTFLGQPNLGTGRIDNAIQAKGVLSILAYGTPRRSVKGLRDFPVEEWPSNVELLYYSFHIMAGLGTLFIALMALANFARFRGRLESWRGLLWALMLAFPFPYIANTAGWLTAELGRQPYLVYGLFRTLEGYSRGVSSGNALFTLLGFAGLYFVLGLLFLFLVAREIAHGPGGAAPTEYGVPAEAEGHA
ncbi:MAG TPA: cytochrome ubiquinol oxidase subunit I [Polyangiaceae bacterium]|nr:cytochrome ubiquinol oxidase subunit I [Polyangiaceae bacterium]